MTLAETTAARSTCIRMRVGAVLVDSDGVVRSTGYNGPPRNYNGPPCAKEVSLWSGTGTGEYRGCPSVHAEQNAILFAGYENTRGGTLYCTATPCEDCAKIIAQSGISEVVTRDISDRPGVTVLEMNGVNVREPVTGESLAPAFNSVVDCAGDSITAVLAVSLLMGSGVRPVRDNSLSLSVDSYGDVSVSGERILSRDVNDAVKAAIGFVAEHADYDSARGELMDINSASVDEIAAAMMPFTGGKATKS